MRDGFADHDFALRGRAESDSKSIERENGKCRVAVAETATRTAAVSAA
jgi:IS1 family transposase